MRIRERFKEEMVRLSGKSLQFHHKSGATSGCPSFEGYKPLDAGRRKKGDEPPHHRRCNSGSRNRDPRNGRSVRERLTGEAATDEPDAAVDQRNRPGAEHTHGNNGRLERTEPTVRLPVASVRLHRSELQCDEGCHRVNGHALDD